MSSNLDDKLAGRRKNFKKGIDADQARRNRENEAVQIRKADKAAQLQRRRKMEDEHLPHESKRGVDVMQLPEMVLGLQNEDPALRFQATRLIRKLLSIEQNPPIQQVIDSGCVPTLVAFLDDASRPDLQFEAAWALTNIASGNQEQTKVVVDHETVPIFVRLLASPSVDVKEQAVWALGNIAGDSPPYRNLVLQHGVMDPLLTLLRESDKFSVLRNATWALSNLCRGKPQPDLATVSCALPTLANLLYAQDNEVLTDSCWALSYISDGPNDRIQAVIEHGVCRRLVELLGHSNGLVQTPALRTIGNIVTGDDRQTQVVIQCGAIEKINALLYSPKRNIRKEACWSLSNITAGNRDQISEILGSGSIPRVKELLETGEFDVKKEAAWVISNATSGGSPEHVDYLVKQGCVKPLCMMLEVNDTKIVGVCLDALDNILKAGAQAVANNGLQENPYTQYVEECDGLSKIESLQHDYSDEIYQRAVMLLESYFPIDDAENEDGQTWGVGAESMEAQANEGFTFGNSQQPQGGFNF